jgi:hypothetical protein
LLSEDGISFGGQAIGFEDGFNNAHQAIGFEDGFKLKDPSEIVVVIELGLT